MFTIVEYEAIGEFKPSYEFVILGIAWENTKTRFLSRIKLVNKLTILHHFLYTRIQNEDPARKRCSNIFQTIVR